MTESICDIDIARAAKLLPIEKVGSKIDLPTSALYKYGPYKAKLDLSYINSIEKQSTDGKLVLVTAVTPTPAGEGKTTTSIGLADAMTSLGHKTMLCLREPSLGPCFGMKGGATGGGRAQVAPMDEINLYFTGDFYAVNSANNLLAAMLDNHIYWGNALKIDPARITWRRVVDMNDRTLRHIVAGVGGDQMREYAFDITAASEVMAILCLAKSIADLEERLGRVIVAQTFDGEAVTVRDLQAAAPMTALLRDAFQPNLVQTLEGTPVFVHGGPFANIAHGCNSLIATQTAMKLADYVVTEAGFGADLGAEKFFNIKCRQANLKPAATVIVATVRALKMHGGVAKDKLGTKDVNAVKIGLGNLKRHIENIRKFNVPVIVAINHFIEDTEAETEAIIAACKEQGVNAHTCRHWEQGGKGTIDLAREVIAICDDEESGFKPLYPLDISLADKINTIAKEIYRARAVDISPAAAAKLKQYEASGFGKMPVCMAKTQFSFSADPKLLGAPEDYVLPVRDVRLSAGAGFVVALCGEIMTMPGLPRDPAAHRIHVGKNGLIEGLF